MTVQTGEQVKQEYVDKMGEALGSQYAELVRDIALLHQTWFEFVELYGTKTSRIELINNAAPQFFRMVQDRLLETVMLQIARLTDQSYSNNNKARSNLTIHNLPDLINDVKLRADIKKMCKAATDAVGFARDWRNRHIAHRDLKLAIDENAEPLPTVQIQQVNDALASFKAIINAVSDHYGAGQHSFKLMKSSTGAVHLIYLLDDGLKARKARNDRLSAGTYSREDLEAKDL
jgi:AbiU2